jgi:DNA-directed RNA polymerase III subunit RPC2
VLSHTYCTGVLEGKLRYGTVFGGDPFEEMSAELVKHGFNYSGKDFVTSGAAYV